MRWASHDDNQLRRHRACGLCDANRKMIILDERLKADPTELEDTWKHELMHACLSYWTVRRPRKFDRRLEELVISVLTPMLIRAERSARISLGGSP